MQCNLQTENVVEKWQIQKQGMAVCLCHPVLQRQHQENHNIRAKLISISTIPNPETEGNARIWGG